MHKLYDITNFDKVPLMYAWVHLMGEGFMGGNDFFLFLTTFFKIRKRLL